jgi:ribonuclease D
VWGNDACLKLSETKPTNKAELGAALGATHHVVRRYAGEVLDAVAQGLDDEGPPPKVIRNKEPARDPNLPPFTRDDEPLMSALKKWRNGRAASEGLAPGLIVNNAIMRAVAALKPASAEAFEVISDMRRWQREAYAEGLLGVVEAWKKSEEDKAAEREANPKKKRRRRRRRGSQSAGSAGDEGGSERQKDPTESAPT